MTDSNTQTPPSKIQREFTAWYEREKLNGLKDVKFFPGDVAQATIDAFITESSLIDQAIENKRHSPLPDSL